MESRKTKEDIKAIIENACSALDLEYEVSDRGWIHAGGIPVGIKTRSYRDDSPTHVVFSAGHCRLGVGDSGYSRRTLFKIVKITKDNAFPIEKVKAAISWCLDKQKKSEEFEAKDKQNKADDEATANATKDALEAAGLGISFSDPDYPEDVYRRSYDRVGDDVRIYVRDHGSVDIELKYLSTERAIEVLRAILPEKAEVSG